MSAQPRMISEIPSLPERPDAMHKGDAGRVLIVAGSRGMSGAALLAALGAIRTGAGLVRVACPASVLPLVASAEPSIMTLPLPETASGTIARSSLDPVLREVHGWAHAVALGPGLSLDVETRELVMQLISRVERPMVIDADALNALACVADWWTPSKPGSRVLTPHPGEFRRLQDGARLAKLASDDESDRVRAAWEFARLTATVVILKGYGTVVTNGEDAYVNRTGNPGMAAGGMGDVLTGIVAALLARGMEPLDAAVVAVHAHGAAGDLMAAEFGPFGYTARELAGCLPRVWQKISRRSIGFR